MKEAIGILCTTVAFLPVIPAQTRPDPTFVSVSTQSWVIICIVVVLPLAALFLIWTCFVYCIYKNHRYYRKQYKELERKKYYLMRRQQLIKEIQQQKAKGHNPAPASFNQGYTGSATGQSLDAHKDQHSALRIHALTVDTAGNGMHNRGGGIVRIPHSASTFHDIVIQESEHEMPLRVNPHLQYQYFPREPRQQQQRQFQDMVVLGVCSRPNHESSRGYISDYESPFSFQQSSPTGIYLGEMPARDYPQPRISTQPSNYNTRLSAFGQLSTWPQCSRSA